MADEQWMSMRTAAKRLGVSANKISRLASKGRITTRDNPLDERMRLVDFNELRTLFESAPKVITDEKKNGESEEGIPPDS
jgi:transposase